MKPKNLVRKLALCTSIALTVRGHSAAVTKSATGTDLADGAGWGGSVPTAVDTATWNASSLGAGLSLGSAAAWQGISVTSAASDVGITGTGNLTLGSGGIDLSLSTVNLSLSNNIAFDAGQTWKAASGKTISASGVISGSAGLTIGGLAPSVTSTTFLTTTAQTLFPNASLANVIATSGKMGGAFVNSGTPVNGTGYLLSNNGSTATYWLEALDGGFTKGVAITLTQSGADITAKATASKFVSGSSLGFNFNTGGSAGTLATSQAGSGYGAHTTTLKLGADSTGTVILSGVNTYSGATTVNAGILRAGIASVPGTGGAFGNNSSLTLANVANTGLDLNGFDSQVGSLTGGGSTGGGITLGSATLTTGGDNSSPAAYAGVISGTGGLTKVGGGIQILSGANTYQGTTTINGSGTLTGSSGTAFTGTQGGAFGTGNITVNSGATLKSTTAFVIGGGQNTTRAISLLGGTLNFQGAGTGGEYLKTLNLTGSSAIFDSGSVYFRAPNGGTSINSLASSTSSTITTGIDMTLGNLAVDTAQGTVPNGQDLVISGAITQNTGAGSGAKNLTKTGAGTLVLSGTSTYTGTTSVNAGTLLVTGSLATASGSTVNVAANATLGGTGTVNRNTTLAANSILAPGGSAIGTLSINGSLSMSGKTVCQIDKTNSAPTPLTQDKLFFTTGTLTYGGALEVTATGDTLALGDSFKLFDALSYAGGFTAFTMPPLSAGLSWDLSNLTADGTVTVVNFVGTPVFSPAAGGYQGTPSVTISSDSGATIYYTVNGSTPTTASPVYSGPITLPANTANYTIKAFAKKSGQADSPVTTSVYSTIDSPTWTNNGDGFWSNQSGDELNWQNSVIAGGSDVSANFSTLALAQDSTITLDGSRSIGSMAFGDASATPAFNWALSPASGSTLTLQTSAGTPSITVNNQTTTIGAPLGGTQGVTKSGAGTLKLTGTQPYTGDTTVNAGTLLLDSSAVTSNTAQLASGKIINNSSVSFYRNATGFTHINASLSGASDYFVDGPGGGGIFDYRVAMRGAASDNTGTVRIINNGRLWVDMVGVNAIGDSAIVNVGPTASFHVFAGVTETIGGLEGSGEVWGQGNAATLVVGGGDKTASFSGALKENLTPLAVTKIGTGIQTLAGTNSYTGATTVNAGTLGGTGAAGSNFTVKAASSLSPGSSVGTMDTKALTCESGSTLKFEINSSSANADKIVAHGAVSLTGTMASFVEIGSGTVAPGTKLMLLDYTGQTLTGTFNGLAEGASVTIGANTFTLAYADSSKVTLTTATGSGFSSWAATNAPGQTINMDHDNDGVANGVEYFMGLSGSGFTSNPAVNGAGLVSWPKGASYTGTYGTDYVIQTSTNLGTWTDVPLGNVTIDSDSIDYTLPAGNPKQFARLKVTGP